MTDGMRQTDYPVGHAIALPALPVEASTTVSALAAAVGFLFSARTIFVLISARWLNTGTEPGVFAALLASSALVFVAIIGAIGNSVRPLHLLVRTRTVCWVLAYVAFAGLSLLWSASPASVSSAVYWASLSVDVGLVVLLFRACSPESVVRGLLTGFIAGAVLLAVIAWIMPAESDLRLGDLDYFNTNQIANLCALAILLTPVVARRGSLLWQATAVFLAFTLLRSLSKSTIAAFAIAQAYRLWRDRTVSRRGKWFMLLGAALAVACFWTLLNSYYNVYTSEGNQAETLTGRTAIWAWSLDAALKHPWIGNGFDAMWKVAPPFGGELFKARHAENEILQQFFAYGVCGIVLLTGIYGSLCRSARRLPHPSLRTVAISVVAYAMVRGIAEAEPFDLLLPLWLATALALLLHEGLQSRPGDGSRAPHRGHK